MDENKWTASTSTSWIWFDEDHTIKTITGVGGQNIVVYVDEAEEPTSDVEGTVVITVTKYNDKGEEIGSTTITRIITRCAPCIVSTSKTLEFEILKSGDMAGPCENGVGKNDGLGLRIDYMKLTTVEYYSNGNSKETTKNLYSPDVVITYILPGGEEYSYLPQNKAQDRQVTVRVQLVSDSSVRSEKTFWQRGILDETGNYKNITNIGDTSAPTVTYEGFDINPKDTYSDGCEAGEQQFSVTGTKVTTYGSKSGLTECGEQVTLGGESPERIDISTCCINDVVFSVDETNIATMDSNGLLRYPENTTRREPITLHVHATLGDKTTGTTYNVSYGTDCGDCLYLVLKSDVGFVETTGGTITFKYYLSEYENGDEMSAVKNGNITFSCPSNVTRKSDEGPTEKGVYTTVIEIPANNIGDSWTFTATCDSNVVCNSNQQTVSIKSYKNVLPECDYFVFNYKWNDDKNGAGSINDDLDSLTLISNFDNIVGIGGYGREKPVNQLAVGYASPKPNKEVTGKIDGNTYIKWGDDSKSIHGKGEGTIVCLRNVVEAAKAAGKSEVVIDIYACWYRSRTTGNMQIEYKLLSGLTENHNFDDEIIETDYTFSPKDSNSCVQIGDSSATTDIEVSAYGTYNYKLAKNVDSCLVTKFDKNVYSHVMRITHNIADNINYVSHPCSENNEGGLVTTNVKRRAIFTPNINVDKNLSMDIAYDKNSQSIEFNGFYIVVNNGQDVDNFIFSNEPGEDEMGVEEISFRTSATTNGEVETAKTDYHMADIGQTRNCKFLKNITVSRNAGDSRKLDISFDMDENTDGAVRKASIEITYNGSGILSCGKAYGMSDEIRIVQNYQ